MTTSRSMARAGACLLLSFASIHAAQAQQADRATAPEAPEAQVPATIYQPTLSYQAPASPAGTPDRNWVASNQLVAATNSMSLTMKPRAGQPADPHAGHVMAQTSAQTPAQATDTHAGHAMQGMQGMQMGAEGGGMCAPPAKGDSAKQGMQCMQGKDDAGKDGKGCKMACCESGCCCKDKMKKEAA